MSVPLKTGWLIWLPLTTAFTKSYLYNIITKPTNLRTWVQSWAFGDVSLSTTSTNCISLFKWQNGLYSNHVENIIMWVPPHTGFIYIPNTWWSPCHLWGIYQISRVTQLLPPSLCPCPVHQTGFNGRFNTSMGGYSWDRVWQWLVQIPVGSTTLRATIICSYPIFGKGESSTNKLHWQGHISYSFLEG